MTPDPLPQHASGDVDDGLGTCRRLVDRTGTPSDARDIVPSLAAQPAFAFAARERATRLASFRHASFARIRGVERTGAGGLRVWSDPVDGVRVSALLAAADAGRLPVDVNAALCVMRQLMPAVATLHGQARDLVHGALAPSRLLLTDAGRVTVTDYVFGAALEQARYPRDRYWHELGVAVPASDGPARFDARTDVLQLGMVALSLILNRPVAEDEFPGRIGDLLSSTWAVSPRGGFEPMPSGLRAWLARALQIDPSRSFAAVADARTELELLLGSDDDLASPARLVSVLEQFRANPAAVASVSASTRASSASPAMPEPSEPVPTPTVVAGDPTAADRAPRPAPSAPTVVEPAVLRVEPATQVDERPWTEPAPLDPVALLPVASASEAVTGSEPRDEVAAVLGRPTAESFDAADGESVDAGHIVWWRNWKVGAVAAAMAIVAVAGVTTGARRGGDTVRPAVASGTLEVNSEPAGAQALIDGVLRGETPLVLAVEPGTHVLELRGRGEPRTLSVTVGPGMHVAHFVEMPRASSPPPRAARARAERPPAVGQPAATEGDAGAPSGAAPASAAAAAPAAELPVAAPVPAAVEASLP